MRWSAEGLRAFLISAEAGAGGGAMMRVPATLGEALAAFVDHCLAPDWRSSNGLALHPERLA